jgi:hypothetical protein
MNEIYLDGKVSAAYVLIAVSQNLGQTDTSYFQTAHTHTIEVTKL